MTARPKRDMVKFNLMIDTCLLRDVIDEYRKSFDNPPPRAEAIRDLIRLGWEKYVEVKGGGSNV